MPIEICLLGCAHRSVASTLAVLASEPDLRLAAAWDPDRAMIPREISGYAVDSLDTAIRRADAAVVAAPVDVRPEVCVRAARAGRPVLVEAPVAISAREGGALAREIARSRTPALAAMFLRELPALGRLRGALRAGVLGRLAGASARLLQGPAPSVFRRPGVRRPEVGGLRSLGIHLVDALQALGQPTVIHALSLDGAAQGPDVGGAGLGRWGPAPLTIRAGWIGQPQGLQLTLTGTAATAVLRNGSLELISDGSSENWIGAPPDPGESLRRFATLLRARRLSLDGLVPAVRAQEALERAEVFG